ncbi:3170_t:CDS:2, partial [Acaulospora colombiana]
FSDENSQRHIKPKNEPFLHLLPNFTSFFRELMILAIETKRKPELIIWFFGDGRDPEIWSVEENMEKWEYSKIKNFSNNGFVFESSNEASIYIYEVNHIDAVEFIGN